MALDGVSSPKSNNALAEGTAAFSLRDLYRSALPTEGTQPEPVKRSAAESGVSLNSVLNPFAPEKGNVSWKDEIGNYALNFAKTGLLFTPTKGRIGLITTVASGVLHAATERNAKGEWTPLDGALGFAKGVGLKYVVNGIGGAKNIPFTAREFTFPYKAFSFGITTRTLDSALSTRTYFDKESGEHSGQTGLRNIVSTAFSPKNLAIDFVTFGAAHGITKYALAKHGEALARSPVAMNMLNGGAFGFSGGAIHELERQREMGETINVGKIAWRGLLQAGLDSVAAAPGGALMARQQRIDMAKEARLTEKASTRSGAEPASLSKEFEVTGGKETVSRALKHFRERKAQGQDAYITAKVREVLGDGRLGPVRLLGIAHGKPKVGSVDILISCQDAGPLKGHSKSLFKSAQPVFMEAGSAYGRLRFTASDSAPSESAIRLGNDAANKRPSIAKVLTLKGERDLAEAVRGAAEENPFVESLRAADKETMWVGNEAKVIPLAPTAELVKTQAFREGIIEELSSNDGLRKRLIQDLNRYRSEYGEPAIPSKGSVESHVKAIMEDLPEQFVVKIVRPEAGDLGDGGRRPFDAPAWKIIELEDGLLVMQERLIMGRSEAIEHLKSVIGDKYEFVDPGTNTQVGYSIRDRQARWPLLVDYTAVDKAGGSDRTIMAITRGQAEDDGYTSKTKRENAEEANEENLEGFRQFEPSAELAQRGALHEAVKELRPEQRKIVEELVNSPESARQAEQDAVIVRWSELGFAPEAERQARQEVKQMMAVARKFRSDW
ncbi:MAG TPA: hypothetical protein V6D17_25025 [Candidatus Obscuribacterales bacterium]